MRHHWTAQVIAPAEDMPVPDAPVGRPAALLRAEFTVRRPVASAELLVTALGVYEFELNGQLAGDLVLAPGWTSYQHRHRFHRLDVTALLSQGVNAWGAHLADGWWRGRLGFGGGQFDIYGSQTGLLAELHVTYADGTRETFRTGPEWRSSDGPVTAAGLYEGEHHDARRERTGWSRAGFDDSAWAPVQVLDFDTTPLFEADSPPVRRIESLVPASITTTPHGHPLVDFGQNLTGRLRIRVHGEAGQVITLRHAEVLENGELCTRPLREAAATDRYTLRGEADGEEWEPRFTFHGFRYAELAGWPGELTPDDVTAQVLHSDLTRTGWFECSDPELNQLHDNIVWGMRGNVLDVPTDCPQRDERLGWTGDIQVFAPTASFLFDMRAFLRSWLRDLAADQSANEHGIPRIITPFLPLAVPGGLPTGGLAVAGWCDAAVIVPWVMYERYGDAGVLAEQYPSMRAWVDAVEHLTTPEERVWDKGFQLGDWLDPTAPADQPLQAMTPNALVATAYFARSAHVLARTAALLDRKDDAARYRALADAVRDAWRAHFHTGAGILEEETQTAYALALSFDLLTDADERRAAGDRLAALVAEHDHRIGTGFLGTPLICDALADTGHLGTAYRLLLQRSCPSWLYQVTMGATTIWERWDSMLPDGSINPGEMTSFNHYALGAIGDFLHRVVAGLAPAGPGYSRILVRPRPGGGLTYARAVHETPHGTAEVAWRLDGNELVVDVSVPPGTDATIDLPGTEPFSADAGTHTFRTPYRTVEEALTA